MIIFFQCFVLFFYSLFLDLFGNDVFGPVLTDGVHEITFSQKFPAPELLFYFWTSFENFQGYKAFDHYNNFCYAIRRNALNQKMNIVFVHSHFHKKNSYLFSITILQGLRRAGLTYRLPENRTNPKVNKLSGTNDPTNP